jgi:hypothetical protein
MLEQMLEADLEALAGHGSSPVAMHVRECGRCRAVAEQLAADTRLLASAVETVGATVAERPGAVHEGSIGARRRMPRGRYLLAGSLAAAALALVVVRPGADERVQRVAPSLAPSVAPPASTASSAPVAAPDRVASRAASPRTRELSSPSLVRSALRPFPRARPVTATPFAAPAAEREVAAVEPRAVVSVTPPSGMRVAVMRTRDPGLTVVWLY